MIKPLSWSIEAWKSMHVRFIVSDDRPFFIGAPFELEMFGRRVKGAIAWYVVEREMATPTPGLPAVPTGRLIVSAELEDWELPERVPAQPVTEE